MRSARVRGGQLSLVVRLLHEAVMRSQYFLAGNLWLIFAALAIVGRKFERSGPEMYSFFGFGRWFSPTEYATFVGALFVAAAVCFVLQWRSTRGKAK